MSPTLLLHARSKSYRMGNSAFKLSSLSQAEENEIERRDKTSLSASVSSQSSLESSTRRDTYQRYFLSDRWAFKLVISSKEKCILFFGIFFPRRLRRKINSRVITNTISLFLVFTYIICLYNWAHNVTMCSLTICFQMEDEGNHGNDDTRCFILSTLAALQWSRVTCVLCRAAMLVFDRYPLVDGTFFLSPRQHSPACAEVCFSSSKIL